MYLTTTWGYPEVSLNHFLHISRVFGFNFITLSFKMIVQGEFEWSNLHPNDEILIIENISKALNQHLGNRSLVLLSISMPEHAYKIVTYTDITSVEEPSFWWGYHEQDEWTIPSPRKILKILRISPTKLSISSEDPKGHSNIKFTS